MFIAATDRLTNRVHHAGGYDTPHATAQAVLHDPTAPVCSHRFLRAAAPPGYLRAALGGQYGCSCHAPTQATQSPTLGRRRILPVLHGIRHLPGRDIDHELAELDRVTGAAAALDCHDGKYGTLDRRFKQNG